MLLRYLMSLVYLTCVTQQATQFQASIRTLLNGALNLDGMQDVLDNDVRFTERSVIGTDLVNQLVQSLSNKVNDHYTLIRNLKDTVEHNFHRYRSTSVELTECCNVYLSQEVDYGFQAMVNRAKMCLRKSEYVENAAKYATSSLLHQFKSNLEAMPGIKYQYFGSEHGLLFSYPAAHATDCNNYDPRFRPWYVETATSLPKDIVVVIDVSRSMNKWEGGRNRLDIAKSAATTVIGTLNPKDRIGVVSFSNYADSFSGDNSEDCYRTMLAVANPHNKRTLNSYIDGLQADGLTFYARAFEKAFTFFVNADYSGNFQGQRKKAILFLTDGDPSDAMYVITGEITSKENLLGNDITIMAFAIGGVTMSGLSKLEDIANTAQNNPTAVSAVTNLDNLRKSMASYYRFFGDTNFAIPHIATPYFDAFGLGLITTVSLPVYHSNNFIGVVGIDLSLSDIFEDIALFEQDAKTYAFVIDTNGPVVSHPMLPVPVNVKSDPVDVQAKWIEKYSNSATDVLQSMKDGNTGSTSASTTVYYPKGDGKTEGMVEFDYVADYYWKPVPNSPLSAAVKINENSTHRDATLYHSFNQVPFIYHEMNLMANPPAMCKHFYSKAVIGHSVVKFAAKSFKDPYLYLNHLETVQTVSMYQDIIDGNRRNDVFVNGISDMAAISAKVDDIWFEEIQQNSYAVWRYIGFANGVIRLTPGTNFSKAYDPTQRNWYKRSIASPGYTVLSPPYLDAFGAGYVITLSNVLYQGGSSHDPGDPVIGVMAMDLTINYIYYLLISAYPECKQSQSYRDLHCFILDSSGYIVVHQDFVVVSGSEVPLVSNMHVTIEEKAIATYLISRGQMIRKSCNDISNLKEYYYYEINPETFTNINNMYGNPGFDMTRIEGTNVFAVVAKIDSSSPYCPCRSEEEVSPKCHSVSNPCMCPCCLPISSQYQACSNGYSYTNIDDFHACTPTGPTLELVFPLKSELDALEPCYNIDCSSKNYDGCVLYPQCNWCVRDEDGTYLEEPYCGPVEECYFGQVGFPSPYGNLYDYLYDDSVSFLDVLIVILQVLVPCLIIGCIITSCYKRYKRRRHAGNRPQPYPVAAPPEQQHQNKAVPGPPYEGYGNPHHIPQPTGVSNVYKDVTFNVQTQVYSGPSPHSYQPMPPALPQVHAAPQMPPALPQMHAGPQMKPALPPAPMAPLPPVGGFQQPQGYAQPNYGYPPPSTY